MSRGSIYEAFVAVLYSTSGLKLQVVSIQQEANRI
jgi:hypothetical protein